MAGSGTPASRSTTDRDTGTGRISGGMLRHLPPFLPALFPLASPSLRESAQKPCGFALKRQTAALNRRANSAAACRPLNRQIRAAAASRPSPEDRPDAPSSRSPVPIRPFKPYPDLGPVLVRWRHRHRVRKPAGEARRAAGAGLPLQAMQRSPASFLTRPRRGGPLLAQRSVDRRSPCFSIAPSSLLAMGQNRLRADAST